MAYLPRGYVFSIVGFQAHYLRSQLAVRAYAPGTFTGPHMDSIYVGDARVITCWAPLHATPPSLGHVVSLLAKNIARSNAVQCPAEPRLENLSACHNLTRLTLAVL